MESSGISPEYDFHQKYDNCYLFKYSPFVIPYGKIYLYNEAHFSLCCKKSRCIILVYMDSDVS